MLENFSVLGRLNLEEQYEKKIGILVALLFGGVMIFYGFFTIQEEKESVSKEFESEIERMLVDIEENISGYLEYYENVMVDFSLTSELLYDAQEKLFDFSKMEAIKT